MTRPTVDHGLPADAVRAIIAIVQEEPVIQRMILYGSRAKGCAKAGSDIDLALVAPGAGLAELQRLEQRLDDLLLPWRIDVAFMHMIENPELLAHIERVGVVWYQAAPAPSPA